MSRIDKPDQKQPRPLAQLHIAVLSIHDMIGAWHIEEHKANAYTRKKAFSWRIEDPNAVCKHKGLSGEIDE